MLVADDVDKFLCLVMMKVFLVFTYIVGAQKEYVYATYGVVVEEIDISYGSSYVWKEHANLDDMRSRG